MTLATGTENLLVIIEWYDGKSHLLDKHPRYEGDEIAFVVAENDQIALDAIKDIKIEFEELNFSTDAQESLSESAYKNYASEWDNRDRDSRQNPCFSRRDQRWR